VLITEVRVKGEQEHQVLPREEIGRLLERGEIEGLFKFAVHERTEPSDDQAKAVFNLDHSGLRNDRPVASSIITTAAMDRDQDIVRPSGLDVAGFVKNPLVLGNHTVGSDVYPVGLARKLKQTKTSWWAQWEWLVDLDATQRRAAEYMEMWDAGVLNATSIGFLPTKWEPIKDAGWDFTEAELLEFSNAFIPSNREAMRTEGVKALVQCYGEMCMSGPSPLAKSFFEQGMAAIQPKQVAVGKSGPEDGVKPQDDEPLVEAEDTEKDEGPGDDGMKEGDNVKGDSQGYETLEDVRLACAAGVLPTEEAFKLIEQMFADMENRVAAATQRAEDWKRRAAVVAAEAVLRG